MKNKKAFGLALALSFWGSTLFTPMGIAQAGEEPAEVAEDFEPTEGAPQGTIAVDPALREMGLYKKVQQYEALGDGKVVLRQTWPELNLADGDGRGSMLAAKNFPRLAAALEEYNSSMTQEAYRVQGEMREEALTDYAQRKESGYGDSFMGYSWETDLLVKRADALVLSFVEKNWTYLGGAHGVTTFHGVNFDASTGERLSLHQVFPDPEMLVDAIIARLREENKPGTFNDNMESVVADGVIHDKVSWTLGPRGATFYFNPYEIAAYASGMITVTFPFDERPGLFNPKYNLGPASYCEEIPPYELTDIVLQDDGTGRRTALGIYTDADKLTITLGGKKYEEPFIGSVGVHPVFVHTGAGKNYLYVDYGYASPQMGVGRQMEVFALDRGKPEYVGILPYSFQRNIDLTNTGEHWIGQWIMTDPYEFNIDEPHVSTNGKSKTHTVEISENGLPAFG